MIQMDLDLKTKEFEEKMGDLLDTSAYNEIKGANLLEQDLEKLQMAALMMSKESWSGGGEDSLLVQKESGMKSLALVDLENEWYSQMRKQKIEKEE